MLCRVLTLMPAMYCRFVGVCLIFSLPSPPIWLVFPQQGLLILHKTPLSLLISVCLKKNNCAAWLLLGLQLSESEVLLFNLQQTKKSGPPLSFKIFPVNLRISTGGRFTVITEFCSNTFVVMPLRTIGVYGYLLIWGIYRFTQICFNRYGRWHFMPTLKLYISRFHLTKFIFLPMKIRPLFVLVTIVSGNPKLYSHPKKKKKNGYLLSHAMKSFG